MRRAHRGMLTVAGVALVSSLLVLAGCFLFNGAPRAIIVAEPLSGESPLVVTFDGRESTDPEGEDLVYRWDFGGGQTSTEPIVDHTFLALTETTVFTVTLRVTDPSGASNTATQTIEVRPGAAGGGIPGYPTARIAVDRVVGRAPLTVSFDGRTSEPGVGSISHARWEFGNGQTATGLQASFTYSPEQTTTFRVTLMVWNSEGALDAEQIEIVVIVPDAGAGDEAPTAAVTASTPLLLYESPNPASTPTLYEVLFDPRGSYADAGHAIEYYEWDFGDGTWRLETEDLEVRHVYELSAPARTYVVRLSVYDDQGLEGTKLLNLTLAQPDDD